MKKPVERSKHVPYENDSAWEPDHEEDAIEVIVLGLPQNLI